MQESVKINKAEAAIDVWFDIQEDKVFVIGEKNECNP